MIFEWEEINCDSFGDNDVWWDATSRAKVIGGWLIKDETFYSHIKQSNIIFISDPNHEWEVDYE